MFCDRSTSLAEHGLLPTLGFVRTVHTQVAPLIAPPISSALIGGLAAPVLASTTHTHHRSFDHGPLSLLVHTHPSFEHGPLSRTRASNSLSMQMQPLQEHWASLAPALHNHPASSQHGVT
jgi:hypothetical protein